MASPWSEGVGRGGWKKNEGQAREGREIEGGRGKERQEVRGKGEAIKDTHFGLSSSSYKGTNSVILLSDHILMASSKPNYLPQALSSNATIIRG